MPSPESEIVRAPSPVVSRWGAAEHADWVYSIGTQPAFLQLHSKPRVVRLLERLALPHLRHELAETAIRPT